MMHKLFALSAALLLSSVAVVASADDENKTKGSETTFKALDRDADQRLSQTEASGDQSLSQHFAALDKNSDGYLTQREYAGHMKGDQRNKEGREY